MAPSRRALNGRRFEVLWCYLSAKMHQHQAIDSMEGAWFFLILARDGLWNGPNLAKNKKKKIYPHFFHKSGVLPVFTMWVYLLCSSQNKPKNERHEKLKNSWKSIIPPLQSVAIPRPQKGLRAAFPGPAKENPLNTSLLIPPRFQKSTFQNFRFRTRPLVTSNHH